MKTLFYILSFVMVCAVANAVTSPISPSQNKRARLYVASDVQKMDFTDHNYFSAWETENTNSSPANWTEEWKTNHYEQHWTNGLGGGGSSMIRDIQQAFDPASAFNHLCTEQMNWPATNWENIGQVMGTRTSTGDCLFGDGSIQPPEFGMGYYQFFGESCAVSDPWPPRINFENANHYYGPNWEYTEDDETYTRHAQTQLKLLTGGRAVPHGMCLFQISGEAREVLDKRAPPYNPVGMAGIPPQNVRMGVLGNLGADRNLWVALPDGGTTVEVTPQVAKPFYIFDATEQKYSFVISANSTPLSDDSVMAGADFCVGQYVPFSAGFDPALPENPTLSAILWTFNGNYVNDHSQANNHSSDNYFVNTAKLTNPSTYAWWLSGNNPSQAESQLTAHFTEKLTFANGQSVPVFAKGLFNMYRPSVNQPVSHGPFGWTIAHGMLSMLSLESGLMDFEVTINSTNSGSFGLTQLVDMDSANFGTVDLPGWTTYGSYWLDDTEYFVGPKNKDKSCELSDPPGVYLLYPPWAYYHGFWKDYVRFTPPGGIAVTLGRIDWLGGATASYYEGQAWFIDPGSDSVDGPWLYDDDSFPVWTNVKSGGNN